MSQSVKLKDDSYIDSSDVWDANQSCTLSEISADVKKLFKSKTYAVSGTVAASGLLGLNLTGIPQNALILGIVVNDNKNNAWVTWYEGNYYTTQRFIIFKSPDTVSHTYDFTVTVYYLD